VYSDCLLPQFIDDMNEILASGEISYDVEGIRDLGSRLREIYFENDTVVNKFIPDLEKWMIEAI